MNTSGDRLTNDREKKPTNELTQYIGGILRATQDWLSSNYWEAKRKHAIRDFTNPESKYLRSRPSEVMARLEEQGASRSDAITYAFQRVAFEQICFIGAVPVNGVSDMELRRQGINVEPSRPERALRNLRLVDLPRGWRLTPADDEPRIGVHADEGYIRNENGEPVFSIFYRTLAQVNGGSIGYVSRIETPAE